MGKATGRWCIARTIAQQCLFAERTYGSTVFMGAMCRSDVVYEKGLAVPPSLVSIQAVLTCRCGSVESQMRQGRPVSPWFVVTEYRLKEGIGEP